MGYTEDFSEVIIYLVGCTCDHDKDEHDWTDGCKLCDCSGCIEE